MALLEEFVSRKHDDSRPDRGLELELTRKLAG